MRGPPLAGRLFLLGLLQAHGGWEHLAGPQGLRRAATGAAASALLAGAAWAGRAVDGSGALAGFLLSTLIWAGLGTRGFLVFAAFVILGSAATRLGLRRKTALGLAQAHGGRRSARHALANCGVAAACALLAAVTPQAAAYRLAFAGALAAALADTVASEIGQLSRRRPVLLTTWKPVAPGTDGAVSGLGTLASAGAALLMGGLAWAVGLLTPMEGLPWTAGLVTQPTGVAGAPSSWPAFAAISVAGFAGSLTDSLLGATLQRRGLLGNDAVNFLNTLVGALVAVGSLIALRAAL